MKVLKILLYILLALVALFLILGLFAPKVATVERSVTIDAPRAQVWDAVNSLKDMDKWSPWTAQDPNVKLNFEGEDGAVGSKNTWESEIIGSGSQTITKVVPNERVDTKLEFTAPRSGLADGYVSLADDGNGTKATWGFSTESPYPWNAMNYFVNMDKMVGGEFEKGLKELKSIVESMPKKYNGYEVRVEDVKEMHFVGKKETVGTDKLSDFFASAFGAAAGFVGENMAGSPSGLYFTWDEENNQTECMAAIPCKEAMSDLPKGLESFTMPAGKMAVIDYYGPYENSMAAHTAMEEYFKSTKQEMGGPVMEAYVTDPSTESDSNKWLTKVYYPIK